MKNFLSNDLNSFNKNETTKTNIKNTTSNEKSKTNKFKFGDLNKQQVLSITYEEIGLFPRSFNRVFDRFFKQIFSDVENLVIQEYRFYRYLFLTTIKCVSILIFVPLLVNILAKSYFVRPITEYYWNSKQPEIFLNSYQQQRAFAELHEFEEKIYFESLILPRTNNISIKSSNELTRFSNTGHSELITSTEIVSSSNQTNIELHEDLENITLLNTNSTLKQFDFLDNTTIFNSNYIQQALQQKMNELAIRYNNQSIESITNFFADLISFFTLCFLFFNLEIQINITKSFLLEVFFGLDDSKKSLLILFITDLLVGYHSPNIWELFFQFIFYHYGLPENQTGIFLLVATLPVLLDVLFKYLIFRHLNRASPATVATYHAMIE
jgi:hypothetical protein